MMALLQTFLINTVFNSSIHKVPISVAARSKAWVCGRSVSGIAGSNSGRLVGVGRAWMSVFSECCVLSGRGLCDGLTTRKEEFNRVWCA